MTLRLPPALVERARQLVLGGEWEVPEARPAATVALIRDGVVGLEVLLMRRPGTMAFAPGMHVFPGGRVDPSDVLGPMRGHVPLDAWVRGTPGGADREALSRSLYCAAVRETFEEAGVLLAVDENGDWPSPDAAWDRDRAAAQDEGAFPAILQRRGLSIDPVTLAPIAHWVTPEVESRRYDTRFLLAVLPQGQWVQGHPTETEAALWIRPADALTRTHAMPMLPPTIAVLNSLAEYGDSVSAMTAARTARTVPLMPRPVLRTDLPDQPLEWVLVDAYSGERIGPADQPAGSEVHGTNQ